ncbi:hypothetical protein HAX54_051227 [Datura stramonium]|uniref:Uncharacterized protein n=1 Tax=Datura stramonium TaxID=4076 RepID=A0ABS8SXH0_DATST|nr:hypothetical protein [Datura stramonium]
MNGEFRVTSGGGDYGGFNERQRRRGDRGATGRFGRKRGGDGEGRLAACSPEKMRERRERAALVACGRWEEGDGDYGRR